MKAKKTVTAWCFLIQTDKAHAWVNTRLSKREATDSHAYLEKYPRTYRIGPIIQIELPLPPAKTRGAK
jgi:hypothetical protein